MTIASRSPSSRSSCQTRRASPASEQAPSASRSSHEPGNWMTPQRVTSVDFLDLVVLDKRVRKQLLAELGQPLGVACLELDHAADPYVLDAFETERGQRPLDGLALGVEDSLLGPDQDPSPSH